MVAGSTVPPEAAPPAEAALPAKAAPPAKNFSYRTVVKAISLLEYNKALKELNGSQASVGGKALTTTGWQGTVQSKGRRFEDCRESRLESLRKIYSE